MTQWILYDISELKQSRNGNDEYVIVSFFNSDTKKRANTYITMGYRNNDWWADPLVNNRYGIYKFKSLKTKTKGNNLLIDGDSIPQLVNQTTQKEAQSIIDIMK